MRGWRNFFSLLFLTAMQPGIGQPADVPLKPAHQKTAIPLNKVTLENKKIPPEILPQVAEALAAYPELGNVSIHFRFRRQTAPLTSRPRLLHVFKKPGRRTYVITLSRNSKKKIEPILFHHLGYEAQVGVLGHELAHIAHYEFLSPSQMIRLGFHLLNDRFADRFEFQADDSCIDHGLGLQLRAWSSEVRSRLEIPEWKGYRGTFGSRSNSETTNRYMNPDTILARWKKCIEFLSF